MKDLRVSILWLIAALGFLFNVERLDFGQENVVNLSTSIYVLATIAALSTLAVRAAARLPPAMLAGGWAVVFLLVKLASSGRQPLAGGVYTYLLITELVLLGGVVWACHRVARGLGDFEEAVEEVTMDALGHRFVPLRDFAERLQDELQLSRRLNLKLSLVALEPDPGSMTRAVHRMIQEAQKALAHLLGYRGVASVISETLRRTDILIEDDTPGRFLVLCRATDREGSQIVEDRLRDACARELGVEIAGGRACFPDDALAFEELRQIAASRMNPEPSTETS